MDTKKDTCHDDIGLCARDIDTIVDPTIKTNRDGMCVSLKRMKVYTLT